MGYKVSAESLMVGILGAAFVKSAMSKKPKKKKRSSSTAVTSGSGKIGSQIAKIKPNVRFISPGYTRAFSDAELRQGFIAYFTVTPSVAVMEKTKTFWREVGRRAPDVAFEVMPFSREGLQAPRVTEYIMNKNGEFVNMGKMDSANQYLTGHAIPRGEDAEPFVKKLAATIEEARAIYKSHLS